MSTYTSVVISPETTTSPVFTSVSHATRPVGSSAITASRTPSEIWSAILSGWPSVTDSDVNRNSLSDRGCVVMRRESLATAHGGAVHKRDALLMPHPQHRVADPDRVEASDRGWAGRRLPEHQYELVVEGVAAKLEAGQRAYGRRSAQPDMSQLGAPGALHLNGRAALRLHELQVPDDGAAGVVDPELVEHPAAGIASPRALVAVGVPVEFERVRERVADGVCAHHGHRDREADRNRPAHMAWHLPKRRHGLGARWAGAPAEDERSQDERHDRGGAVQRGQRQRRRIPRDQQRHEGRPERHLPAGA